MLVRSRCSMNPDSLTSYKLPEGLDTQSYGAMETYVGETPAWPERRSDLLKGIC